MKITELKNLTLSYLVKNWTDIDDDPGVDDDTITKIEKAKTFRAITKILAEDLGMDNGMLFNWVTYVIQEGKGNYDWSFNYMSD